MDRETREEVGIPYSIKHGREKGRKKEKKKSVAITDSNEAIPYLIIIKCTAMDFLEYISRCLFEGLVDI